ncbi:arylsulfatase [Pleomorphovibrio marinus]|uniref:arylsulfatase n=1 Tax=Pleomorphovibrio marinus TaxID=2164132 RepID=UPI000E0BE539|nr:arylsulfatase [Pleomorphovibrio marinus]
MNIHFIRLPLLLALLFVVTLSMAQQPHIILIMTDQQRGDAVGYAGNSSIITPNLDQLAGDGVYFTNAYSSTPSCTPARAALLTGMSPWGHGMLGYGRVARKYPNEMPAMLREAGYYTYGIGKFHWFPQKALHGFHGTLVDESGRIESEGFISDYRDWFKRVAPGKDPDATGILWNEHNPRVYQLEERLHPDHWKGEMAVDFIDSYDLEAPLFLKVSFSRPHSPYDPPQRFLDLYEIVDVPVPFTGDWSEKFRDYPNEREAAFGDFGVDHALESRKHYYALITFLDEQIGKVVEALKRKGVYENSLILFVSDHGDMLGDHHHWRKSYAYEGSSKVPMLIKPPHDFETGLGKEAFLTHPVEIRDILPTFLDAAKIPKPTAMEGESLIALMRDPQNAPWREYIDLEHATTYQAENYWCALTDGKEKYIWFFRTGEEQLFDLSEDPGESRNLASEEKHLEKLESWRDRMAQHLLPRGEEFVKQGELVVRDENLLYGPNYPQKEWSQKEALDAWKEEVVSSFIHP